MEELMWAYNRFLEDWLQLMQGRFWDWLLGDVVREYAFAFKSESVFNRKETR